MQKTVPNDQRVEQHCADVGEKRHEQEIGEDRVRFAQGGVAVWAHIGGFVAGVVLIKLFARHDDVMAHQSHHWEPRRLVGR